MYALDKKRKAALDKSLAAPDIPPVGSKEYLRLFNEYRRNFLRQRFAFMIGGGFLSEIESELKREVGYNFNFLFFLL